jgi:DNA-binding CsgD family transcriptional regulator
MSGGAIHQIAVILDRAQPTEITPLIVQSYGLSLRESEITRLIAQGLATTEIAATCHITAETVQDHCKSIFDKVGVRSRRELVAQLFERHFRA